MNGEPQVSSPNQMRSAERLRTEFDRAFAEPARAAAKDVRDYVLIATGSEQWALPLDGICGIEHDRALVRVPSRRAALLGLAGVRSAVVPVFDLAMLLATGGGIRQGGAIRQGASRKAPVFALLDAGSTQRVGLAFERLLQFARVGGDALRTNTGSGDARRMLQHEQELYEIVEGRALLHTILADGNALSPAPRRGLADDVERGDSTK